MYQASVRLKNMHGHFIPPASMTTPLRQTDLSCIQFILALGRESFSFLAPWVLPHKHISKSHGAQKALSHRLPQWLCQRTSTRRGQSIIAAPRFQTQVSHGNRIPPRVVTAIVVALSIFLLSRRYPPLAYQAPQTTPPRCRNNRH
jgi:hypothetical protein